MENTGATVPSPSLRQFEDLIVDDPAFAELESMIRPYCPFEALGMIGAEVRHGNFLAYMLDPFRPHGYGASLLRAFLSTAVSNPSQLPIAIPLTGIEAHLLDLGDAEVRREWRSIDILIVIKEIRLIAAIELKIDAIQSTDQLLRYRKTVEEHWPGWAHLFVFLTKNDEIPHDTAHWLPVGLSDLMTSFEKRIVAQTSDRLAAQMLAAYIAMMRRQHLEDRNIDEIVRKLWATHGEVLGYLADRRPDEIGESFDRLAEAALDICGSLGTNWTLDTPDKSILRFAYRPWDNLAGFNTAVEWTASRRIVLFELKREGDDLNGAVYLAPGEERYRSLLASTLAGRKKSGRRILGARWALVQGRTLFQFNRYVSLDIDRITQIARDEFIQFASTLAFELDPLIRGALGASLEESAVRPVAADADHGG